LLEINSQVFYYNDEENVAMHWFKII
jgi:hypothetical protein